MNKNWLQKLAGLPVTEAVTGDDKRLYNEEMKNVVKAIMTVWHRAKGMGIDYDSFERDLNTHISGAKKDLD